MHLRDLLHGVTAEAVAPIPVAGIACHSKQVRPGDVFVAIEGPQMDGHAFIAEAIARGAAAVVAQRLPGRGRFWAAPTAMAHVRNGWSEATRACPCVVVRDSRQALLNIATRFYGNPSRKLRLIGVTGTNGKTTTTYLLKAILESAGARVGMLGTVIYQIGDRRLPSTNTTPGPLELSQYFAQMVGEGLEWCAMEVSSHALDQGRVAGLEFESAVFTNLGSDHLDYHKTQDAYAAAKRKLFDHLRPGALAVINSDDAFGRVLAETIPNRTVLTYGAARPARALIQDVDCSWHGIRLVLDTPWGLVPITTPLLGRHNVWNIAAAATTLLAMGISTEAVQRGLAALDPVPGRLERVPNEADINVLIDYAHTAEAMRLVLASLRELTAGRLIVVFGCGGDRDQSKRAPMGRMAGLLADYVVVTSDNPRGEHPMAIIEEIRAGFPPGFSQFDLVPDREQAISAALSAARQDDTILIAGKGHETYQFFDHVSIPFADRDVIERCLRVRPAILRGRAGSSRKQRVAVS
jgi:UDP-N-acetylmuramoyl-L-alanyl-D-glutamate--2,6-diaminopimelate ligase